MNYDNNQQYGFNLGLNAAGGATQHHQAAGQNVAGNIYQYAFQGMGQVQQQLPTKVVASAAGQPAAMVGKNILYHPQPPQHIQQQQQLQHLQQPTTFSMVQGQAVVGRQGVFQMTASMPISQEPLCSPQTMVDVYGNLSPNILNHQKPVAVPSTTPTISAAGYKQFAGWMNVPHANLPVANNPSTGGSMNTCSISTTGNQPTLPSIGHLLSHFQQQHMQKQQATVTAFLQPQQQQQHQPQQQLHQIQQQPIPQQSPNFAGFQSVQLFHSTPAGSLQVSPGGIQVSPGGQAFQVPHSMHSSLSSNPMTAAGVSISGLRQVHVPAPLAGTGIRSQVVMAPRGQLIMTQPFNTSSASFNSPVSISSGGEVRSLPSFAKFSNAGMASAAGVNTCLNSNPQTTGLAVPFPSSSTQTTVSVAPSAMAQFNSLFKNMATVPSSMPACSQVATTTTTMTVTTSTCSPTCTTATTVHTIIPLAATISVLPTVSSVHSPYQSQDSDTDAKADSGRGLTASPSTPSTSASTATQESCSGESGVGEMRTIKIPYSWRRIVEKGIVLYYSPSNICLSTLEEIRAYLTKPNTCKCGLECPLLMERTFSFDPTVEGKAWSIEDVTCSQDLTKLCNHKRKVLALAAFQSSTSGQDASDRAEGPPTKCRKRDKGKHGDNLLVSPLVVDSKLKTSITNAVNKHAVASLHTIGNPLISNVSTVQNSSLAIGGTVGGNVSGIITGHSSEGLSQISCMQPVNSAPPNCVVDHSGSIHYPSSSPMSHSPASIQNSTPGESMEGLGQITSHFPGRLDFGRNHLVTGMGVGMERISLNHMDARQFAVQGNILSQEDMKQAYFVQHQQQYHQNPMTVSSMSLVSGTPQHPGTQGFRAVAPMGLQGQYPVGYPHHQQQAQIQGPSHPQHPHQSAMLYSMNMQQQQQQAGHHHHHQQQPQHHQNLFHHHQQAPHTIFQSMHMNSPTGWGPQPPPPSLHHPGQILPPGFLHPNSQHSQGGNTVLPDMYPQMGDLLWLETGKPKSKRPRSKKDKQKLNSIVDRTSPCATLKVGSIESSGCFQPPTSVASVPNPTFTTAITQSLPQCSVSFLENPAVFVAQQSAIIKNSLASCQIDLNSPPFPAETELKFCSANSMGCNTSLNILPTIKIEHGVEKGLEEETDIKYSVLQKCKKEPVTEELCDGEQDKSLRFFPATGIGQGVDSSVSTYSNGLLTVTKNELEIPCLKSQCESPISKFDTANSFLPNQASRKKASLKSKGQTKVAPTVNKLCSTSPTCISECASPSIVPQYSNIQLPNCPPQETNVVSNCVGTGPLVQTSDLSQVLGAASGFGNLTLQQALAQYGMNSNILSAAVNTTNGQNGGSMAIADFPASNLLTAAARGQLQQNPLNSLILPAFLTATGMSGQDLPLIAALHNQQQDLSPGATIHSTSADLSPKSAAVANLVGISQVAMPTLSSHSGSVPVQMMQGGNVMAAGVMHTGGLQNGTVVSQSTGLPLNIMLSVNQQLTGSSTENLRGISVDMSGHLLASMSAGPGAKAYNISPKIVTASLDAMSPGNISATFSPGASIASYSPQSCSSVKGSTIHHLPQPCISHSNGPSLTQNISSGLGQSIGQNITVGQGLGNYFGQNIAANLTQSMNQAVGSQLGQSGNLGIGETVILNSLMPSIVALNTSVPPISMPVVTNVTNSLTPVIPAAGTAQTFVTQQHPQQQATAQFLSALGIPPMAAALANPLLITNPVIAQSSFATPMTQVTPKSTGDILQTCKDVAIESTEGRNEMHEEEKMVDHLEVTTQASSELSSSDCGKGTQLQQSCISQAQQDNQPSLHQAQQLLVLPGTNLPFMQVLNSNTHPLTTNMMDSCAKLCNTTQIYVPTMTDLTQLGTVAALTPLGIQQMWNSLNSLQLQQLQTLQLQQLVWQQLQGMQAIPHHIAIDATAVAQQLQAQYYTDPYQQQTQTSACIQQPLLQLDETQDDNDQSQKELEGSVHNSEDNSRSPISEMQEENLTSSVDNLPLESNFPPEEKSSSEIGEKTSQLLSSVGAVQTLQTSCKSHEKGSVKSASGSQTFEDTKPNQSSDTSVKVCKSTMDPPTVLSANKGKLSTSLPSCLPLAQSLQHTVVQFRSKINSCSTDWHHSNDVVNRIHKKEQCLLDDTTTVKGSCKNKSRADGGMHQMIMNGECIGKRQCHIEGGKRKSSKRGHDVHCLNSSPASKDPLPKLIGQNQCRS